MKYIIIMLTMLLMSCNGRYDIKVDDSEHLVRVENPIIEYCKRLYPEILYPDLLQRETNITECLKLCSETNQCSVDIPIDDVNNFL